MTTIKTSDPKVALLNITHHNCSKMHKLAELMQMVCDAKDACGEGDEKLFTSARSPECLDRIMKDLVFMFKCEANCDVTLARLVADGQEVKLPRYFDENLNLVDSE